jgi:hypothetical protein
MAIKRRSVILLASVLLVGTGLCVLIVKRPLALCGWQIVWRDAGYWQLLNGFRAAQPIPEQQETSDHPKWQESIRLVDGRTTAVVSARSGMDVLAIKYSDEPNTRPLYKYLDYSAPLDVRLADGILYVHWTDGVISSTEWVLSFDLERRQEVSRRLVVPDDLRGT